MPSNLIQFTLPKVGLRNLLVLAASALLVGVILFAFFFIFSNYGHLADWYYDISGCFYNRESWETLYFTEYIKYAGNVYCVLAIGIACLGLYYLYKRFTKPTLLPVVGNQIAIPVITLGFPVLLVATCLGFWAWGNHLQKPAFDEVFSAVNCADAHPFTAWSYYMLPNNHIGFNLLNGLLFHFADDKLVTGRILSLIAYFSLVLSVYGWFTTFMRYRFLAFVGAITVALQFSVWGYGFQNRGYEWYSLATFVAFVSYLQFSATNNKQWLRINVIACVVGNVCVPTFFYYQAAQWLYSVFLPGTTARKSYWVSQLIIVAIVFLFYLPAFCFSGVGAFIANPYVVSISDLPGVVGKSGIYLIEFATYCYSGIISEYNFINVVLFLAPILLVFRSRSNRNFANAGRFFLVMWLVVYVVVFVMRRYPNLRNMAGHECITLSLFIAVGYWLTDLLATRLQINAVGVVLYLAIVISLSVHFAVENSGRFQNLLYNYNTVEKYTNISQGVYALPPETTLACTNESFYAYYLAQLKGISVTKCPTGNEKYLIKQTDEKLEDRIMNNYEFVVAFDNYRLFRKK